MREFSIPALVEVADTATLTDVVFDRASQSPELVMLRKRAADGQWRDVTAREFGAQVRDLAKGLLAAGISAGDRVGLMARTSYAWTLIDYALWAAGAVTVPVYETSSAEQVEWILSDSGACAAFAETTAHAATIEARRPALPDLARVWQVEAIDELASSADAVTDSELEQRLGARKADDLATIIYTSGTTGRPKGCELTHANLLSGARNAVEGALIDIFEIAGSSTLLFLPLAHSFARIIEVGCLESGAILEHWPDASTVAAGLPEARPTFLLAVPRVFEKVYNSARQQASASKAKDKIFSAAVATAIDYSRALPGSPGAGLKVRHAVFDRLVYSKLRAAVGGNVRYAVSGGAPSASGLALFRGAGITIARLRPHRTSAAAIRPSQQDRTVGQPIFARCGRDAARS